MVEIYCANFFYKEDDILWHLSVKLRCSLIFFSYRRTHIVVNNIRFLLPCWLTPCDSIPYILSFIPHFHLVLKLCPMWSNHKWAPRCGLRFTPGINMCFHMHLQWSDLSPTLYANNTLLICLLIPNALLFMFTCRRQQCTSLSGILRNYIIIWYVQSRATLLFCFGAVFPIKWNQELKWQNK